ncbi:MAG TPA: hypothetical protein VJR92_03115 [Gemmatimonadaceae bacterium]|nr:hypothetical protein [Gemmatimonadaceae bacterium]
MRHAAMYHGSFERNFVALKPGTTSFEGSDGGMHPIPAWPASADGMRIGYMEKTGKKFMIVRVQRGNTDIVLKNELVIDLPRHFGHGKRLGPEPTLIEDDGLMVGLLEDLIRKNPEQATELMRLRTELKTAHPAK